LIQQANKSWHGVRVGQPDWSPGSHCMVLNVELKRERRLMHLIMNAYWEPLDVELPREGRQSHGVDGLILPSIHPRTLCHGRARLQ
jgi:glycogen operon protein